MKKFDDILYKFEFIVSSVAFVSMITLIVINVFYRLALNKTIPWTEEMSYAFFNWAVFIGICMVYRNQGMVAVGAIVDKLPKKIRKGVMLFVHLLVFSTNICLVIWGLQLSIKGMARITSILKLPYFWIDLSIPVGGVILAYYSAKYFLMTLKGEEVKEAALEERS